jgi:hypothetical protein
MYILKSANNIFLFFLNAFMKKFFLIFAIMTAMWQTAAAQTSPDLKWVVPTVEISALTFAPDDSYFVTGCRNNELHFYNVETGEIIDTIGLPGTPSQIKFTHDGKRMIVAIPLRLALVFDAVTHELIKTIDLPGLNTVAETISISYDDKYLTYGPSDSICIISLNDYKPLKTIGYEKKDGQSKIYITGTFTNDNQYVIVQGFRSFQPPKNGTERIFDVFDMKLNKVEHPFVFPSNYFKLSESGNYGVYHQIVNNDINNEKTGFYIWQYPGGSIVRFIKAQHGTDAMVFSNDSKYFIFTIYDERKINIYNINNGDLVKVLQTEPSYPFRILAYSELKNYITANSAIKLFLFNNIWSNVTDREYLINFQVVPQPSNENFTIILESIIDSRVSISITDLNGFELLTLYEGMVNIGRNAFNWDTHGFASGTYFINIQENGRNYTQKVILTN